MMQRVRIILHFISFWPQLAQTMGSFFVRSALSYPLCHQRSQNRQELGPLIYYQIAKVPNCEKKMADQKVNSGVR